MVCVHLHPPVHVLALNTVDEVLLHFADSDSRLRLNILPRRCLRHPIQAEVLSSRHGLRSGVLMQNRSSKDASSAIKLQVGSTTAELSCRDFAVTDLGQTVNLHNLSLSHGKSNADLAPTIAFDCALALLAIFALVLPATKKILKRVKPASEADQRQDDGPSTVSREGRRLSPPASSSSNMLLCSSLSLKTPPPRPVRSASPRLLSLPKAQMRFPSYQQSSSLYG